MTLPFLLVTAALGWFQLTLTNYIEEHYGLMREKKPMAVTGVANPIIPGIAISKLQTC